jgi:hypothetical protein
LTVEPAGADVTAVASEHGAFAEHDVPAPFGEAKTIFAPALAPVGIANPTTAAAAAADNTLNRMVIPPS